MNRISFVSPSIASIAITLALFHCHVTTAQSSYISFEASRGNFTLSASGRSAPLYVSENDFPGVIRAAKDLQQDIQKVTDQLPVLTYTLPFAKEMVLIGTIEKNKWIDELIRNKKLDTTGVYRRWEAFVIQTIEHPFPGVDKALVIAGSDKRGTIFGIYDLSRQIGVSPWHWWADVPPKKTNRLFILPGRYVQGEPQVKYRGIFINDEEPALGRWAVEKYGGFTHQFYEKVFELLLRHKANYLWPAMWWASFSSDDPLNPQLADEYGIVIGTTHHEPMMRAHAEWKPFGGGEWNYETNPAKLQKFWQEGIQRMSGYESIISLGMRGDGDKAMTEETNIALLQRIVADQRKIITEVTGKEITKVPQLWALYKEVQDYYDKGMNVPDDVTLLLCDDNWGNIRKLPKPQDKPRSGGYGIYYHFDYVGGPRNYKWMNTNPLPRVWEQMNLAYQYGANQIWIVNVGDIKPLELPTSFFLDYAWNPAKWNAGNLSEYTKQWAAQQFGNTYAEEIAVILQKYSKYNGRRKPELLTPDTYSLVNYREAESVVFDYNQLTAEADQIYNKLPPAYKDAFYQLVLFPVKASATLNELFITVGKNRLYAKQGRASTNDLAVKAKELFANDSALAYYYNHTLAGGRWNHMMDQTHISYTYWQQPVKDIMPNVSKIELPAKAEMGVAVEGSESTWPQETKEPRLPEFDSFHQQKYFIEIFNRGQFPFTFSIKSNHPWLKFSIMEGEVKKETRINVSIDWSKLQVGIHPASFTVHGPDGNVITVKTQVRKEKLKRSELSEFAEDNGLISIEAAHFNKAVNSSTVQWKVIDNLGRTGSAVTTVPVTAQSLSLDKNTPHLEYQLSLYDSGKINVRALFSPTLNFHNTTGLHYAISIDDEPPQIINLHEEKSNRAWERWVSDNILIKQSTHHLSKPGKAILKFWMIDPGVVLQKIIIDAGGLKPSYLGPPESSFHLKDKK